MSNSSSEYPVNISAVLGDFLFIAGPVLVFSLGIGFLIYIGARLSGRSPSSAQVGIVAASGVLGGALGAIAGSSTEPLIGGLVTGVIGLATTLLTVALGKGTDASLKAVLPIAIISLLLNSIAGLSVGRNWRLRWDNYGQAVEASRAKRDQVLIPVLREFRLGVIRKCLEGTQDYRVAITQCSPVTLFPEQR